MQWAAGRLGIPGLRVDAGIGVEFDHAVEPADIEPADALEVEPDQTQAGDRARVQPRPQFCQRGARPTFFNRIGRRRRIGREDQWARAGPGRGVVLALEVLGALGGLGPDDVFGGLGGSGHGLGE